MKTIVGVSTGIIGLVAVGFLTWAILSEETKEPQPDPAEKGFIGFGMADHADPPLRHVLLDADRQLEIWTAEHAVFEIEHRFGPIFRDLLTLGDTDGLAGFFREEFVGSVPTEDWQNHPGHLITRRTRDLSGGKKESSVTEVAAELVNGVAAVATANRGGLVVEDIKRVDENHWACRLHIEVAGRTEESKPVITESRHDVQFQYKDEKTLDSAPTIKQWHIVSQESRVAPQQMMEEVTKDAGLSLLPIPNNRQSAMGAAKIYWFNYAIDDFDADGDPDLAITSIRADRLLLRNDDGVFHYAGKSMGLPVKYGEVPLHHLSVWIDDNNDGYPDLISGREFFRNEGGRKFRDTTTASELNFEMGGLGAAVADFDCDGLLDLYVLQQRSERSEEAVKQSWIADSDGGGPNHLWRNLGDGRFEEVTDAAEVGGGPRESQSAVWFFYNDDHYPDLYVANERGPNQLFQNRGDGTFADVSATAGIERFSNSFAASAGDVDNDGRTEIYESGVYSVAGRRVVNLLTPEDYPDGIHQTLGTLTTGNRLLRHSDDGLLDTAAEFGVADGGWAFSTLMTDFDSDGWLDLYVANGFLSFEDSKPDRETSYWRAIATEPRQRGTMLPQIMRLDGDLREFWSPTPFMITQRNENLGAFQQNRVFLGVDGRTFEDAGFGSGANIDVDSRSAVCADFDSDGALDLIVGSANGSPLRVFRNTLPQGGRLDIRLEGVESNRQGIGSRVIAEIGDRQVVRDVFPAGSFLCSGPAYAWIGIGSATQIDRLTVRWPTGKTQVFENVSVNRRVRIREGDAEITTLKTFGSD